MPATLRFKSIADEYFISAYCIYVLTPPISMALLVSDLVLLSVVYFYLVLLSKYLSDRYLNYGECKRRCGRITLLLAYIFGSGPFENESYKVVILEPVSRSSLATCANPDWIVGI